MKSAAGGAFPTGSAYSAARTVNLAKEGRSHAQSPDCEEENPVEFRLQ